MRKIPPRKTKTQKHNATALSVAAMAPSGFVLPAHLPPVEEPEKTREGSTKFSTAYLKRWGQKQGWLIANSERYDFRTGRHSDAPLRMDAWFLVKGETVIAQAYTPGLEAAHLRDFVGLRGFERAAEHCLTVLAVEFVRSGKNGDGEGSASDPKPVKVSRWVIKGVRGKAYSVEEVAAMCKVRGQEEFRL